MVEIFSTNVNCKNSSNAILQVLDKQLPDHHFNFDLDDPELILRVEVKNCLIAINQIIAIVSSHGFQITLITD